LGEKFDEIGFFLAKKAGDTDYWRTFIVPKYDNSASNENKTFSYGNDDYWRHVRVHGARE